MTSPSPMKSPDRDAADEWAAVAIAQQKRAQKAEVEAEEHKTDAEFWKHNAEVRASELATLRRRVAEMEPVVTAAVAWDVARLSDAATAHLLAVTVQYRSPPTRKE